MVDQPTAWDPPGVSKSDKKVSETKNETKVQFSRAANTDPLGLLTHKPIERRTVERKASVGSDWLPLETVFDLPLAPTPDLPDVKQTKTEAEPRPQEHSNKRADNPLKLSTNALSSHRVTITPKAALVGTTHLHQSSSEQCLSQDEKSSRHQRGKYLSPQNDRHSNSSLSTLTQNIFGHARDLHALAKNAASSLLHSSRTSSMLEESLLDPNDESPIVSSDVNDDSAQHQFDPKCPLYGCFHTGWLLSPPTDAALKVMKCHACRMIYATRPNSRGFLPLIPESVLKRSTETDTSSDFHLYPREALLFVLVEVSVLSGSMPPLVGRLVCTNYRVVFEPVIKGATRINLGTQWGHLCNFWEIPLGLIDSATQGSLTSREKHYLMNRPREFGSRLSQPVQISSHRRSHRHDDFVIDIVSKDNRRTRVFLHEPGREAQALSILQAAAFPPTMTGMFAFKTPDSKISGTSTPAPLDNNLEASSISSQQLCDLLKNPCNNSLGWYLYQPEREWFRLIENHRSSLKLRISRANSDYSVCPSYPKLFVVPDVIDDTMVASVCSFRSKHRLPILSWASPSSPATLWRCSQPKSMFNRCEQDERFLNLIASSCSSFSSANPNPLLIMDARPMMNAMVNKASGAGYENTTTNYQGCLIEFANIENIHHVRDAFKKMEFAVSSLQQSLTSFPSLFPLNQLEETSFCLTERDPLLCCPKCACQIPWHSNANSTNSPPSTQANQDDQKKEDKKKEDKKKDGVEVLCVDAMETLLVFNNCTSALGNNSTFSSSLQQVSNSSWYDLIQHILRAVCLVSSRLTLGESVVVHCSDGWDRTAQITSLAMLCCDSFYRTLRGFLILIDQEFIHAGFQFHTRCGHPGTVERQRDSEDVEDERFEDDSGEVEIEEGRGERHCRQSSSNRQKSPIFIQWLDCVYQLMVQYPSAFEFTPGVLNILAQETYSCYYGTFLLDCQRDRDLMELSAKSDSLWADIIASPSLIRTPNFSPSSNSRPPTLVPLTQRITPWLSYWLRYHSLGLDSLFHAYTSHIH